MSPAVKQDKDALGSALNPSIDCDGYISNQTINDALS